MCTKICSINPSVSFSNASMSAGLLQRAQWLGLVEEAGERDLLTDGGSRCVGAYIRHVGQHLVAGGGLDGTILEQRYLLGVVQLRIPLGLHNRRAKEKSTIALFPRKQGRFL
jgi:hypothetical protein